MKLPRRFVWALIFGLLFLLSQDYLLFTWESKTTLLGFPIWLPWFVIIHVVFIVAFLFFSRKYWR